VKGMIAAVAAGAALALALWWRAHDGTRGLVDAQSVQATTLPAPDARSELSQKLEPTPTLPTDARTEASTPLETIAVGDEKVGIGETEVEDGPELWAREYNEAETSRLRVDATKLKNEIVNSESVEADAREEAGFYDVVAGMSKDDAPGEVVVYSLDVDGAMRRVVLPPSEYPELYAKKRKLAWLENEIKKKK